MTLLTRNQIVAEDKSSVYNHADSDCFVIVAMTHGNSTHLHATDDKFRQEKIWDPFIGKSCKALIGKPKLFFIQACRGNYHSPGVEYTSPATDSIPKEKSWIIPDSADHLIMYASPEKCVSYRVEDLTKGKIY